MNESNQTSLDNLSTTRQLPPAATYRDHLTSRIKPDYLRAYDYYVGQSLEPWNYRGQRFIDCHNRAVFARHKPTGRVKILANSCHLRFCPICNKTRERLIQRNIVEWLDLKRYPKFLTLTLKSYDAPIADQIDRLYKSFQALRRRSLLKKKVSSGVWFFQITKNQKTGLWHPHLHCLLTGSYIPLREIRRQWYEITTDSNQVDIRLIHEPATAALEVARYASCSASIRKFDNWELQELDEALHRRRLCGVWGKARKLKMLSPPPYVSNEWQRIGSWATVINNIATLPSAAAIYNAWKNDEILSEEHDLSPFEDAIRNALEDSEVLIE